MKVTAEDVDLVRKIVLAIENSKLKMVTRDYLESRGNLGNLDSCRLSYVLDKYFKEKNWSRQDRQPFYVAKKGLDLSQLIPQTPPEPESPPEKPRRKGWWEIREENQPD